MDQCIIKMLHIETEGGIFDEIVDCTYVLLCCGKNPQREENVYIQLNILKPSKHIIIVYNSGYKLCKYSSNPSDDLRNAQLYIFNHALDNNYKRILYLEDDFYLTQQIPNKDIESITRFINKEDPTIYGLGNLAIPTLPTLFSKHQKALGNLIYISHAIIYNQKYMKNAILFKANNPKEYMIDQISSHIPNSKNYRYYKPLIYQTFPVTENQVNSWQIMFPKPLKKIGLNNLQKFIKTTKLDKTHEPGFKIIYILPYIFYTIIFIFVLLLLFYIYKKLKLNRSNNKYPK